MPRNHLGRFVRQSGSTDEDTKKTLRMLAELQKRIKNGELEVETSGFWAGVPGSWTFRVSVKESEKSQLF